MSKMVVRLGLGLLAAAFMITPLGGCRQQAAVTTDVSLTSLPTPLTTFIPPVTTQPAITFVPPVISTQNIPLTTLVPVTIPSPTAITTNPPPTSTSQPPDTTTATPSTTTAITSTTTTPATTTSSPPLVTMAPPAGARVIVVDDPAGDSFNPQGQPIGAEPYMDIIRAEVYVTDNTAFLRVKLGGVVPESVDDKTFLEWDFFIDTDMNSATGWKDELIANDTGPDYLIRLITSYDWSIADVYDVKENKRSSIASQVIGDTIDLAFPQAVLKMDRFNLVAATRKWVGGNLAAVDKAPNQGHYNMPKGLVVIKPGLPTERLDTQFITVWYNHGNEDRARSCAEAFEAAYIEVDRMWGIHPPRPTLYVYNTRSELVDGLQVFSQFTSEEAAGYGFRGVPRPKNNVTHIPPDSDWRAVYQQQVMVSMDLFC